jgi:hypothetical protein
VTSPALKLQYNTTSRFITILFSLELSGSLEREVQLASAAHVLLCLLPFCHLCHWLHFAVT